MGAGFAGLFIVCVVAYLFNMDKSIYALQERAHPIPRHQSRMQFPPTPSSAGISPDKTCQNKPVPFWRVLEADGEGNLVAVAADRSAPAMGLGDGSHHG